MTVRQTASGRSVLVTGGNRGIGLAIARALADAGPPGDGDPPRPVTTAGGAGRGALRRHRRRHRRRRLHRGRDRAQGPVEVLVSNAGITDDTLLLRMSEDAFSSVVDANLTGSYRVAKRAARRDAQGQRWGRMIFISSVVGLSGGAGQANYASSKAGLVGLARSIARELGSRNITANVIAPGFVDTDMTRSLPEARRAEIIAQVPLGRYAAPDEIAAAVAFLASDGAALHHRCGAPRRRRPGHGALTRRHPHRTATAHAPSQRRRGPHMTDSSAPDCSPARTCSSPASSPRPRWPSTPRSSRRSRARTVVLTGFGRLSLVERIASGSRAGAGRRAGRHRQGAARLLADRVGESRPPGLDGVLHSIGFAPATALGGATSWSAPWEDVAHDHAGHRRTRSSRWPWRRCR